MLKILIVFITLSNPSELFDKAIRSLGEDLEQAQLYLDSARSMHLSDYENAELFHNQGYIYEAENNLQEALLNYHEALRFLKSSGNNSEDARYMYLSLNNNIGKIYYYFSNQDLALKYYNESMNYARESEKAAVLYNIGLSQSKMGQNKEAIESLLEGFRLCLKHGQDQRKVNIQIKIGSILSETGDYSASLRHLSEVISTTGLSNQILAKAHNNYGISSWKMGDYQVAESHFEKTIEIGGSYDQFVALQNLCEMYLEQGYMVKCIDAGTKAEKQYQDQLNNPDNLILFSYLSDAYTALGDYEKALSYSNLYKSGMVSYYDEQKESIDADEAYWIQMVTENYELKVKSVVERNKTIKANIIITSIILTTFILLVWRQQSKKKKMVQEITEQLLS